MGSDAMQGAGARAQERASEVVRQNEQHLESAFGLLSLALAALGSMLLFIPDKVRLLAAVCTATAHDTATWAAAVLQQHAG